MNKFKKNKGITLVALIITIIVLLILAVVSIQAVTGEGIIAHAKNARTEYQASQDNESTTLDGYLAQLDDATSVFGSITPDNYGDKIEYNDPVGVNDWKVFYKDNNYLYIIASDYLANTNLPSGLKMSTYSGYPYSAYWSSTSNFTATKASDSITKEIANKYMLNWFNDTTKESTNANARATADLLNTTAWTAKFGDSTKGIEAIGSPTLEMWVASWNAKGYTKLNTASNATGYYVGTTENPTSYSVSLSSDKAGYADKLYFPHTEGYENCYAYWLASPSAVDSYYVMNVRCNGDVDYTNHNYEYRAVRPLVSVPKALITTNVSGNLSVTQ